MARTDAGPLGMAILDAGPVIHLDELDCLSLLSNFRQLLVPTAVWQEIERHRPTALSSNQATFIKQQAPSPSNSLSALCEAFNLDRGEREAISLCARHPLALLFTDDAAVRLAAKAAGLRAYGTIGVLVRAIRDRQLNPADVVRILGEIPSRSTLFVRKSLLQEVIDKVKKEHGIK